MPTKPCPEVRILLPWMLTSMSSQWLNACSTSVAVFGSQMRMFSMVASENTTPQPNVS